MERKGAGGMMMFFVFIFILTIIGGGIVWGAAAFYQTEYDFRETESEILMQRVLDCFNREDFFSEGFDFYASCELSKNIMEDGKHAVIVTGEQEFIKGVADYKNQCYLEGKNFPVCKQKTIEKDGKVFEITVGSNQLSRRGLA